MDYYAGIDVSLEASSICIVDSAGKIVKEAKVLSEPEDLIAWFKALPFTLARIGLEAGPLSQWLYAGLKGAGFAVELLETRHVRDAFKAMPVKTDRNDARGIAQLLVPAGALQIDVRAGDPRAPDRPQARKGEAPRCGDEPQGHLARLRLESRPDYACRFCAPDQGEPTGR